MLLLCVPLWPKVLITQDYVQSVLCPICERFKESAKLFFSCAVTDQVWRSIVKWLDLHFPLFKSWSCVIDFVDAFDGLGRKKKALEVIIFFMVWIILWQHGFYFLIRMPFERV